jgi:urease beta subunit
MQATCSTETSVNIQRSTRRFILEGSHFHIELYLHNSALFFIKSISHDLQHEKNENIKFYQ